MPVVPSLSTWVVFEMATKGEAGCGLVSDSALHAAIRAAMIEHLGARVGRSVTWMRSVLANRSG